MNIYKYIHWLAAGLLVLSVSACNIGATAPPAQGEATDPGATQTVEGGSTTPTTEAAATEAPATLLPESSGACDNPYLPVVAGATWNYKLTGPVSDTFTHTILSVENDSFTEQDEFGTGVTRQGTWQCEDGNLIALNPAAGNSANVSAEGVSVDFETTELSGVTLPATIDAGDTWSQSLTLEGTQTISGLSYPASNQLTSDCTAIGSESVTVEAGTFDAMRVECQTDMNISIALDPNNPISTPLSLTNIYWYAEDIGMVKNDTTSPGINSTIELVSYNIP
jgi:hypothetical protein